MSAWSYYNEIDENAARVLRFLIADDVIAPGVVDTRSIADVQPDDLKGFTQCHFFAGGGIWSVAARLAGWPDDKILWTGSCPCQPFSVAGKGAGTDDPRHLWPHLHRLISAGRPPVVMGEQVSGKAGRDWFHGVRSDLESSRYAGRAVDVPACAVDAPHIRQRLWWLFEDEDVGTADAGNGLGEWRTDEPWRGPQGRNADWRPHSPGVAQGDADCSGQFEHGRTVAIQQEQPRLERASGAPFTGVDLVDAESERRGKGRTQHEIRGGWHPVTSAGGGNAADVGGFRGVGLADASGERGRAGLCEGQSIQNRNGVAGRRRLNVRHRIPNGSYWSDHEWRVGADGKARRVKPGLRLLVDGMAGRVALLRIGGNGIVAEEAAEMIRAYLETEGML